MFPSFASSCRECRATTGLAPTRLAREKLSLIPLLRSLRPRRLNPRRPSPLADLSHTSWYAWSHISSLNPLVAENPATIDRQNPVPLRTGPPPPVHLPSNFPTTPDPPPITPSPPPSVCVGGYRPQTVFFQKPSIDKTPIPVSRVGLLRSNHCRR